MLFSALYMPPLARNFFPKYTNSHTKECNLYYKLLDKISLETESLISCTMKMRKKNKMNPVHYLQL